MATAAKIIPARRAGTVVRFEGNNGPSALLVLRDAAGAVLPAGSVAYLNGGRKEFYVGYDGMAWIEDLRAENRLMVETGGDRCVAHFSYSATGDAQDLIDPVVCQ